MENERMDNVQTVDPVAVAQEAPKRKPAWKNPRGIALFVALHIEALAVTRGKIGVSARGMCRQGENDGGQAIFTVEGDILSVLHPEEGGGGIDLVLLAAGNDQIVPGNA